MEYLKGIKDRNVRDAVDIFQMQMEIFILDLLGEDRDAAVSAIDETRSRTINYVKNLGSEFGSIDDEAKSIGLALAILEKTFERLRGAYDPDVPDTEPQ